VFTGGTGSSGTTITARLIGEHSAYAFIPAEINFHVGVEGLPGLIKGDLTLETFLDRMRGHHFRYRHHSGGERGLHRLIEEPQFEALLEEFAASFAEDATGASSRLVAELLGGYARRQGKSSWVEMTPRNAVTATAIRALVPGARFIHVLRDGRDVAADKVYRRGMKIPDAFAALEWWGRKVMRADRQARALGDAMLVLRMEDLVLHEREATYRRLLAFLGVEDEPAMRDYFERVVRPERARIGTWHELVPADDIPRYDARYRELLDEFRRQELVCADLLDRDEPGGSGPAAADPQAAGGDPDGPAAEIPDELRPRPVVRIDPTRDPRLAAELGEHGRLGTTGLAVSARLHLEEGRPWSATPYVERIAAELGEAAAAAVAERLERVTAALRGEGDATAARAQVAFDADGRVRVAGGLAELAIAQAMGRTEFEAEVVARDPEWVRFREMTLEYAAGRRHRFYQLVDHPDLSDVPAYHRTARFAMLRDALAGYEPRGKRLLDIGSHWGYMPQQFSRLGFKATGVEHNRTCVEIARGIQRASEDDYEIWEGSIFEYPDAEQQDVVLALNVFNHFIKRRDTHDALVTFLQRLRADIVFFEPHVADQPGKMPVEAYRNYQPKEFAEFVAGHAGMTKIEFLGTESDHYSKYQRSIYKIER
jgi:hypothetical protein